MWNKKRVRGARLTPSLFLFRNTSFAAAATVLPLAELIRVAQEAAETEMAALQRTVEPEPEPVPAAAAAVVAHALRAELQARCPNPLGQAAPTRDGWRE